MKVRITNANYSATTFGELIRIIEEVGNLYELNNVSFEYDIHHRGQSYIAKFKLYG